MRIEVRTLDQHIVGLCRDLRFFTAHDPGKRDGLLSISDDEHVGSQSALDTVECGEFLARCRTTDNDATSTEFFKVECVQRLAQLVKHVVGDVCDVVDGTLTNRFAAFGEPLRGWTNLYTAYKARGVTRTQIRILDLNGSQARGVSFGFDRSSFRQPQMFLFDYRQLTCDTDVR